MIKVLHLLNTSSYSGAENVAITIITNMTITVDACYASFDGPIRNKLNENDIEFKSIDKLTISEVRRLINEFNPDIIHAHDFRTSVVAAFSTNRIPVISHLHNNSPWIKSINLYSLIYLLASFKLKRIICVSDSIIKEYIFSFIIKNKMINMTNPIDLNRIKKQSLERPNGLKSYDVVFVGRLTKAKNPIEFIEIVYKIVQSITDLKVVMIGTGELYDSCLDRINQLQLTKNFDLLGYLNNPLPILTKSKVLCMTSIWEGFGLVAIEALALGVPVVAKPVGGLTEIVNEDCGLLTDNIDMFVNEVIMLVESLDYHQMKSISALKQSYNFDNIIHYIEELNKLYYEVL